MQETLSDVIVIGAGHNGLTLAAYLAKAGLRVLVLERNKFIGGATSSFELNGFKMDLGGTWLELILGNPMISHDELQLVSKYGFKWIIPAVQIAAPYPDGTSIVIYKDLEKTCKNIERISKKDAKAYRKLNELTMPFREKMLEEMFDPPTSLGTVVSELEKTPEGSEILRLNLMNAFDIIDEWFEDDRLKALLIHWACEPMISPWENGTGGIAVDAISLLHTTGIGCAVGGMGSLVNALRNCVEDHGGRIMINSPVRKIKVREGKAEGVILEDGRELRARRAVVAGLHPKELFLRLIGEENLESEFVRKVKRLKQAAFTGMCIHYMLNQAPKYRPGEVGIAPTVEISWSLEDLLKQFLDITYRKTIPAKPCPVAVCWTITDPTRAPSGKHTLYVWNFLPYDLKEGGAARWDDIKGSVADSIFETIREHTTNMGPENIIGRRVVSPLDIERYFEGSMPYGDSLGIRSTLEQSLSLRPMIGWSDYRTPIEKLYMTGMCTHPGAGITSGARATAQVMLQDFGVRFKAILQN